MKRRGPGGIQRWCKTAIAALSSLALLAGVTFARAAENPRGEKTYNAVCIGCHQIGILGAPKFRDAAAWKERLDKGFDTLVQNALNGFGKMPAKGGNPNLAEQDIRAAIQFMASDKLVSPAMAFGQVSADAVPAALSTGNPPGAQRLAASANGVVGRVYTNKLLRALLRPAVT